MLLDVHSHYPLLPTHAPPLLNCRLWRLLEEECCSPRLLYVAAVLSI